MRHVLGTCEIYMRNLGLWALVIIRRFKPWNLGLLYLPKLTDVMLFNNNHFQRFLFEVLTHPCFNSHSGLATPPLKLRYGWVIASLVCVLTSVLLWLIPADKRLRSFCVWLYKFHTCCYYIVYPILQFALKYKFRHIMLSAVCSNKVSIVNSQKLYRRMIDAAKIFFLPAIITGFTWE